jgi:hypothetical protein
MVLGNTMILPEGACWHHDEMITRQGPAARWNRRLTGTVKGPENEVGRNRAASRCDAVKATLLYRAAV